MNKRLLALLLVLCMVIAIIPMAAADKIYADVDSNAWYHDAVQYVSRNGLMTGTGEGSFSPDTAATRGMVMTILARTAGMDTSYGTTWYEAGLNWAVAGGVSDGSNPLDNITREQLAAILYRYAALIGCDMSQYQPLDYFADADKASDWAVEGLEWAGRRKLPAVCTGHPDIYMICKRTEGGLAVGLWNLSADYIADAQIRLDRGYRLGSLFGAEGTIEGDALKLTGDIAPFAFVGVFLEN